VNFAVIGNKYVILFQFNTGEYFQRNEILQRKSRLQMKDNFKSLLPNSDSL